MLLSPQRAFESGWIKGDITEANISPNGIDFTVDRVFEPVSDQVFKLFTDHKSHRDMVEKPTYKYPGPKPNKDCWILDGRSSYDIMSTFEVDIPMGVAALLVIRSTAARGMLLMTSGIFDSGFRGNIGACLHNLSPDSAVIEQGARIGQIAFYDAANVGSYHGSYQDITGHWSTKLAEFKDTAHAN